MKTYTYRDLIKEGTNLKPEDFKFDWKVWSTESKPWFWDFGKTTEYHAQLKCINLNDMSSDDISEIERMPEFETYKKLVKAKQAPYILAAIKAGYSKAMIAPSFKAKSLSRLQEKMKKHGIDINVAEKLNK